MPTLLDFRRRIRSVKNTQQLTRAMKFVAAAKLRRAQERVFAARPYAAEILRVLRSAVARIEEPVHPLLLRRPEKRLLVLVVSGDKSLCGAFNTNVLRRAFQFLRERRELSLAVLPIGKKSVDALRKRQFHFAAEYVNVSLRVEFRQAKQIAERVAELYTTGEADAVYAIYNEFKNVLVQRLVVESLLPIAPDRFGLGEGAASAPAAGDISAWTVDYIYEQPPEDVFRRLVPRYLEAEVFRVLLESAAAEQAARMTAMDAATNNAADLIDQLTLQMNKIRQAAITKEIIEVVSGAASATS
jgi:F-type H+-transporting ATPase subunit gamma